MAQDSHKLVIFTKPPFILLDKPKYDKTLNKVMMSNRVVGYPSKRLKKLTVAYSYNDEKKVSETVVKALKYFFKAMPDEEQEKLLAIYETLTPAQRSRPYLKKD